MMIVLLVIGGLFVASRIKGNGGSMPLFTPKTDYAPWSAAPPSNAGSSGSSATETSPLTAMLMRLQGSFKPVPYVPLSGPGGATTMPGASGSPSGQPANTLQPTAPGTLATYSVRSDLQLASDPRYWWMMPTVDVAIMSEDVNGALASAGDIDLSQTMIEASIGANWRQHADIH